MWCRAESAFARARLVCACGVVAVASPAFGQAILNTVDGFSVLKSGFHDQTGPGALAVERFDFRGILAEEEPAAETILGVDFSWVDGGAVTQSAAMIFDAPRWRHNDTGFASQPALTTAYSSANDYTFGINLDGIGVVTESFDGPGDLWPDALPMADNFVALQTVDPSADTLVQCSGFTMPAGATQSRVEWALIDSVGYVWGDFGPASTTSFTIPAGTMTLGETYRVSLKYESRAYAVLQPTVFTDAFVNFSFTYYTDVPIGLIPGPGAGTMLAVGIGLVGCRRRRKAWCG